jgi:hypothetical protein
MHGLTSQVEENWTSSLDVDIDHKIIIILWFLKVFNQER